MRETWIWSLGQEDLPGERNDYTLQYSWLENSMNREAWWATVHGVAKSRARLRDRQYSLKQYLQYLQAIYSSQDMEAT